MSTPTTTMLDRKLQDLTILVLHHAERIRKQHRVNHKWDLPRECFTPGTAKEINDGWCALWAALAKRLVGGKLVAADNHVFLRLNGKYYDSEVPQGTKFHYDMPYFKRWPSSTEAAREITVFDAFEFWGWDVPFEAPPYHWLKGVRWK